MSDSIRRGRIVAGLAVAAALIVVLVVLVMALRRGPEAQPAPDGASPTGEPTPSPSPPPICPLSGLEADGVVPVRPALAVKVENLPAARPQTGMSWADIVYEEPVEAGITRFIAVYQCQGASRIEPVRSARHTDVDILVQFDRPLFAYSGAVEPVVRAIGEAGIVDVSINRYPDAYHRDPDRQAPHNLYTSTEELYGAAPEAEGERVPEPVFTYAGRAPSGARVSSLHIPFSSYSDVYWRWETWNGSERRFVRYHGDVPHTYSDGTPVTATNVVVQVVEIELTDVIDAAGTRSPKVVSVGSGTAYVLRNGRMVEGRWIRESVGDVTTFVDESGEEIPLKPGQTWVELVPSDVVLDFS